MPTNKSETVERTRVAPRFEETIKRLTLNLKEATRYLVFADLPQSTLEGLSGAVDHLRTTVWAVLNSTVDEFSDGHRATIVLTSHRMQRSQALMGALSDEIDAGHVTASTPGGEELLAALGLVYKKLHFLRTGASLPPASR